MGRIRIAKNFLKNLNVLDLFNKNANNFVKMIKNRIFFLTMSFGGEAIFFDYEPVITALSLPVTSAFQREREERSENLGARGTSFFLKTSLFIILFFNKVLE